MELTIKTDNRPRPLLSWHELSKIERAWHDWDGAQDCDYVRYKGHAYCLSDFVVVTDPDFAAWNGVHHETYFSGVLVRFANTDADSVVVGSYYG